MIALNLSAIRLDVALQPRASLDYSVVEEYAVAYSASAPMPPVTVYKDGDTYWLADGFHRFNAAQSAGMKQIHADVRNGTRDDAIWFAASANGKHGLPRRNADKRRAVEMALKHGNAAGKSDRAIAEHCSVSHEFVGQIRASLVSTVDTVPASRRIAKDGRRINADSDVRSKAGRASAEKRAEKKAKDNVVNIRPKPEDRPEVTTTKIETSTALQAANRAAYALTASELEKHIADCIERLNALTRRTA